MTTTHAPLLTLTAGTFANGKLAFTPADLPVLRDRQRRLAGRYPVHVFSHHQGETLEEELDRPIEGTVDPASWQIHHVPVPSLDPAAPTTLQDALLMQFVIHNPQLQEKLASRQLQGLSPVITRLSPHDMTIPPEDRGQPYIWAIAATGVENTGIPQLPIQDQMDWWNTQKLQGRVLYAERPVRLRAPDPKEATTPMTDHEKSQEALSVPPAGAEPSGFMVALHKLCAQFGMPIGQQPGTPLREVAYVPDLSETVVKLQAQVAEQQQALQHLTTQQQAGTDYLAKEAVATFDQRIRRALPGLPEESYDALAPLAKLSAQMQLAHLRGQQQPEPLPVDTLEAFAQTLPPDAAIVKLGGGLLPVASAAKPEDPAQDVLSQDLVRDLKAAGRSDEHIAEIAKLKAQHAARQQARYAQLTAQ